MNALIVWPWRAIAVAALITSLCAGNVWAQAEQQRPPPGERRGPPQAMIEACSGKAAGEACSAVGPQGRNVEGTCFAPPQAADAPLACRPPNKPRGGGQQNPQQGPPPDNGA
jgi:hypothetical protein